MKKVFVLLLAMVAGFQAFAQSTTVKGVVLDSLTRQGEPASILQFFRAPDADKAVAFTTTDENGSFSHTFTVKGEYTLLYSNMGRKELRKHFTVKAEGETVYMGEILAQDNAEVLKAGSVTAMRPLVKMEVDKMTYNVEDDVDSKNSTVLDMLRKVPMVSVDGQDNITVNGSSSFQVYVDGKPNQMISQNASTVFKMMPASAVKNIEVVTNPGVRYDAEGVGGVLNITTNRAATGGASVADGYYGTVRAQGSTDGVGGGVYGSLQKGKFAMSVNLNAMYRTSNPTEIDMERIQDSGFTTTTHSESTMKMPMLMGNLSASYEIDTLNLVSVSSGIMHFGMRSNGLNTNTLQFPGMEAFSYQGSTVAVNNRNNISASADYQHLWEGHPGRSITLSYQFNASPSKMNSLNTFIGAAIEGFDFTDRRTDGKTNSVDHTAQADFTTPLGKLHTLSTGLKFIGRHNSSNQVNYLWDGSDYAENPAGSLTYDFYNRIGAAYAELSGTYGAFGVKAGVRYEHTWQTYSSSKQEPFSVNYGSLVPTGSVQWNPSPTQNVGITYNMRIRRPGIFYLNPYVDTSDPTAISYGNTELEVEKSHNISLVYSFFSPKVMVNASLRQSFSDNGISDYSFYDENKLLNTTYGNILQSSNTGLDLYAMLNPWSKTRIMINGEVGYSQLSSKQLDQKNSGWNYFVMLSVQQTIPWDLRLSANYVLMGRDITLQGYTTGMSMAMLGLTKSFLNDRLSIGINGMIPISKDFKLHMDGYTKGTGFTSTTSTGISMASAGLSVSWTFGKQGNYGAKRARRSIQNEDQLNSSSTSETVGSIIMQ